MTLFFDDVKEGDNLPELTKGPITATQLVRYSGASGDFNPIHTVPAVAQSVGLDGVIAHGMLTMAFAGQLLTNWAGDGSVKKIKVRFSGMTAPGETVICRGKVGQKSVEDGKHILSGKLTVKGAEDGSLKLKGDFSVMVPKR